MTSLSALTSSLSPTSKLIVCAINKPIQVKISENGYGFEYTQHVDAFTLAIETLRGSGTRVEWVFVPAVEAPTPQLRTAMTKKLREDYSCHPLYLSRDIKGHYGDTCTGLFSVLHGIHLEGHEQDQDADTVEMQRRGLDAYRVVNEHFSQAVSEMYQEGDLVLVYNYQLLLLPNMLRRRCPNATIGFFFDCPFPNTEFFRSISVRESLLNGVLESNLILFHHFDHVISFNNACTLLLGVDVTAQHVHTTKGRLVSVMVCPMGIDPARFDASDPSVVAAARVLQDRLGQYRIVTAVDRLDTIMGIPHKILAFEEFLETYGKRDEYRHNVIFILVLTPPQDAGNFYDSSTKKKDILIRLARQVNCLVGRVNGKYGTADYTPIHYIRYGLPEEMTVALLSLTDVYLATSLSEGCDNERAEVCGGTIKEHVEEGASDHGK